MSPAGGAKPIDIRIAGKSFANAEGTTAEILRDLTLILAPNTLTVVTGPSGCGKTTLLRIVAGLDGEFSGSIGGTQAMRLAMVFQEPRLLPWRSVEDNVRLAAPEASETALARLFEMLGLAGHRNHFPGELSLGLARRVALARAFAVEPDLLLLDEPFVSLDAALASRLRGELTALLAQRPVTSVLVTHDLEEAAQLADRVYVLSARPARVVADIALEKPRSHRSAQEIAAMRQRIAAAMQPT